MKRLNFTPEEWLAAIAETEAEAKRKALPHPIVFPADDLFEESRHVLSDEGTPDLLRMTVEIVSAYVSYNKLPGPQIPEVIRSVFATLNSQKIERGGGSTKTADTGGVRRQVGDARLHHLS